MYLVRLFLNIFLKKIFSSLFYKISSLIVVICPGSTFLNLCKIMYGCIDSLSKHILVTNDLLFTYLNNNVFYTRSLNLIG